MIASTGHVESAVYENDVLRQACGAWRDAISDFIAQAEKCNFTDRHGHSLELNQAYLALKASVTE